MIIILRTCLMRILKSKIDALNSRLEFSLNEIRNIRIFYSFTKLFIPWILLNTLNFIFTLTLRYDILPGIKEYFLHVCG